MDIMKFADREIIIRKMTAQDSYGVAELDKVCFITPWSRESFEYEASLNPLAYYLVAEAEDGSIVGYMGIWHILDEGHITNVAVHPSLRCRGLAEKLISEILACSDVIGMRKYTLEVRISNEAAVRVYKKFGFIESGVRINYYEDNGEDAIIMWKE